MALLEAAEPVLDAPAEVLPAAPVEAPGAVEPAPAVPVEPMPLELLASLPVTSTR
jgi:hypothetical protein